MDLPDYTRLCIARLEAAGYAAYAVGGCVRDALLGQQPQDYDLCTAATPEQIKTVFSAFPQVLAGEKHGTVGILLDHTLVEITTFRRELDYSDHRHPDRVSFVTDIETDLSRRDFTVNAIAYSPTRGYVDPFGGRQDLQSRRLRAVGNPARRFTEDSLRILRGVRFSLRFGFRLDPETETAMLCTAPELDSLARERVFDELCKLLPWMDTDSLLRFAPIFTQLIPELTPAIGFDQRSPYHAYDIFTHTAHTLAAVPQDITLRWAALLHDLGKVSTFTLDADGQGHFLGHGKISAQMADAVLLRLKAPTALRQRVVLLIEKHMCPLYPDRKLLRRRLSQMGSEAVFQLLALQKADYLGTGKPGDAPDYAATEALLQELLQDNACLRVQDLALRGQDFLALGFTGFGIGEVQRYLLSQVLAEALPNERAALTAAAVEYLHQGETV